MTIQILKRRFVDVGMPQEKLTAKGRYQLRKLKNGIYTGEETPWFDNIILDSGLNRWGTGTIIAGAAIGTGTATPASTDTGLQTQSHYTTSSGTGSGITAAGVSPYNNTRTFVYRTTLGSLNGNYSEVGVGWASGSMFSRALILDGGGSPTTISVASDEQLDIVYQLSIYPPLTDTAATVNISGVDYDVTGRAGIVNSTSFWPVSTSLWQLSAGDSTGAYSGTLPAINSGSSPSGGVSGDGTATNNAYSSGTYTRTAYISYGLSEANVSGGIRSVKAAWTSAYFLYEFDVLIPKDATKTLVLNYSVTWARR